MSHPSSSLPVPQLNDRGKLGPAMRALTTDRQRAFVQALLDFGDNNYTRAAQVAGYTDAGGDSSSIRVTAHRLAHDERIQAAMHEEASRRMNAGKIMAMSHLLKIADNEGHKDQLKAILAIADRTGLHATSEHKVTVEHKDEGDRMKLINERMVALGMDADQRKKMLGSYGITDATFEVVEPATLQPAKEEWEE